MAVVTGTPRWGSQGSVPGLLALAKLYSHSTYHDDVLPNQFQLEDQIQAAALLRAAAERGNADAAVSLATSFHHGALCCVVVLVALRCEVLC